MNNLILPPSLLPLPRYKTARSYLLKVISNTELRGREERGNERRSMIFREPFNKNKFSGTWSKYVKTFQHVFLSLFRYEDVIQKFF